MVDHESIILSLFFFFTFFILFIRYYQQCPHDRFHRYEGRWSSLDERRFFPFSREDRINGDEGRLDSFFGYYLMVDSSA